MSLDAPPTQFSALLRKATWARHEGIDPSADREPAEPGVLGALFDGDLHLDDFTAWTAQQYFVYEAIEAASAAWQDDPVAGSFVFPQLYRLAAFDEDLRLLIGPQWRDVVVPNESTAKYVARIREVSFDWPGGYVAHHYTRYMGDLSGGQAFRAAANALYGFEDGPGVSFYRFAQIPDATEFKAEYRRRLDRAPWDTAEQQRVIDEVLGAYDYNGELLAELGRGMRRSV